MSQNILIEVGKQIARIDGCSSKLDNLSTYLDLSFKDRPLFPWVGGLMVDFEPNKKELKSGEEVEIVIFLVPFPTEKMLRSKQRRFVRDFLTNSAIFQNELHGLGYRYDRESIRQGTHVMEKKVKATALEREISKLRTIATLGPEHDPMVREMAKYHKPRI